MPVGLPCILSVQDLLAEQLAQAEDRHSQEICIMQERCNFGPLYAADFLAADAASVPAY